MEQVVVLVNAAPGFEEAVEAALRKRDAVKGITRVKKQNFDMAVLVQVDDAAQLQRFLTSDLLFISGVQGAERVQNPSEDLMASFS